MSKGKRVRMPQTKTTKAKDQRLSVKQITEHLDGLMNNIYMPKLEEICKNFIREEVARQLAESVRGED